MEDAAKANTHIDLNQIIRNGFLTVVQGSDSAIT